MKRDVSSVGVLLAVCVLLASSSHSEEATKGSPGPRCSDVQA